MAHDEESDDTLHPRFNSELLLKFILALNGILFLIASYFITTWKAKTDHSIEATEGRVYKLEIEQKLIDVRVGALEARFSAIENRQRERGDWISDINRTVDQLKTDVERLKKKTQVD